MIGYHLRHENLEDPAEFLQIAADNLRQYGGITTPCFQLFLRGPKGYRAAFSPEQLSAIKLAAASNGAILVAHGSFVDCPWDTLQPATSNIIKEMNMAAIAGVTGVVVHLGKNSVASIKHVVQTIAARITPAARANVTLWLEINACKPADWTFEKPANLHKLWENVTAANLRAGLTVGICVDTAHLHACGLSLTSAKDAAYWLSTLPPDAPIMWHLNDNIHPNGSGEDQHALLRDGQIWQDYKSLLPVAESGFAEIIRWAVDRNQIIIFERGAEEPIADLLLVADLLCC